MRPVARIASGRTARAASGRISAATKRAAEISPEAAEGFGLWSFVSKFSLAFAAVVLLPLLDAAGFMAGATTPEKLATKRPYVIVGAFVIGMLLTPPDIISQTLLALPMWVLFEVGLLMSRILLPHRQKAAGDDSEQPADQATS